MQTYRDIKAMIGAGQIPSVEQLEAAIQGQLVQTTTSLVDHARTVAVVLAAAEHPFPIPKDQKKRARRCTIRMSVESQRLISLYSWLELAKLSGPLVSDKQP